MFLVPTPTTRCQYSRHRCRLEKSKGKRGRPSKKIAATLTPSGAMHNASLGSLLNDLNIVSSRSISEPKPGRKT